MTPSGRALRVGLTGGIATGKSTVVDVLVQLGIPVIDADVLARAAVAPGSPGLAAVATAFGRDVLSADGFLDRKALAGIVFNDEERRRTLEGIVHPEVRRAIDRWFEDLDRRGKPLGVADIPLLFETGRAGSFDRVVVVACAPDTQRSRLMTRDGLSIADANRRLAAQWPIAEKVARADAVVWTDGTLDETAHRAAALAATLHGWTGRPA